MRVKDVMTKEVACVRQGETLSEAARLMWDCDCGSIPVKEDGSERVVGMITDRDICMATWSRDRAPSTIGIAEVMASDLKFVTPDDSVSTAENLMRSKQIRRIPVLDEERQLVGLISLADIATQSQSFGERAENDLAPAAVAATLANICRPRQQPSPGM
jgi:CBS domain-containing protein